MHRELDRPWGIAVALQNLGELEYLQGRYDAAQQQWTEALAGFRTLRHVYHKALLLRCQAQASWRLGRAEEARHRVSASLQLALPRKFTGLVADAWCVLAGLVLEDGDAPRAAALLQAAQLLPHGEPPVGGTLLHDLPETERATHAALALVPQVRGGGSAAVSVH